MVNGGPAERVGGHRRRHGHRVPAVGGAHRRSGPRRWPPPSTSASVVRSLGRERLRRLAGGDRRARGPQVARAARPATHVLPTSVPVPATTTSSVRARAAHGGSRRAAEASSAAASASTWSSVWAADSATRRRRRARARRSAGGWRGRAGPGRAARPTRRRAASSSPSTTGTIGDGWPGRSALDVGAEAGAQARRPRRERTTPSAASAAAVSAGVERGGEDVGAGPVHAAGRRAPGRRRRSRRASRASSTACRPGARRRRRAAGRRARARRGPRRARAARRGAAHSSSEVVDRRDVAVHREHRVGDDDRRAGATGARAAVGERGRGRGGGTPRRVGPGEAAAVDDRRVVQLVGARRARRGPPNVVSTPRLAAKPVGKSTRGLGALPLGERGLELAVHRAGADDEAGRRPSRCPTGRARRAAAATTAGCWVRPR